MKLNDKNKREKKPKVMFSLSPIAIFCALVLSAPSIVNAGVMDQMMEGVYTNTTDAGKYESQKMGHYQGGSFYARFPTKSINIAMFDPPRIQAGCGGIDLFGGSFSFISGDEIVQILRSIGQNALGLLFQMGIQAISQPLSTLLNHFSDKLQQMNQALRNSCAAANKIVSIATNGSPLQDLAHMKDGIKETFSNTAADAFNAFKKGAAQGYEGSLWQKVSQWKKKSDADPSNNAQDAKNNDIRKEPMNGNTTWKALTNSKSYQRISPLLTEAAHERQIKELIINIGGTTINNQFQKGQNRAKCTPASDATPCDANSMNVFTSRYFKADQLKIVTDSDQIYTCKDSEGLVHSGKDLHLDMACVEMQFTPLKDTFKGASYYINRALFGKSIYEPITNTELKHSIDTSMGLIGKGLSPNNTIMPTPEERATLNNTSIPFLAHLFYLQVEPSVQEAAIVLVYEMMIQKYTYMLGQNLLKAADGAFIGGTTEVSAEKNDQYDKNLQNFALELEKYAVPPEEEAALNTKLYAMRAEVERSASTRNVTNRITSNQSNNN